MLIHDKFYGEGNDNFDKFLSIIKHLIKRQRVEFALYCAKDVFHLVNDRYKKRTKCCINLVEKWLIDEKSVTSEELRDVAVNASGAADASQDTDAAGWASWAAGWAASHATWSAADSSWAANNSWTTDASWAAYYAVIANDNKLNEYLIVINSYLTKTNINCPNYEIEGKILYLIDELDENIIIHKDKYYVNMNGIENCPEYGFDTQQELLDKLLYSEDRFWKFVRNWLDNLYKNQQA